MRRLITASAAAALLLALAACGDDDTASSPAAACAQSNEATVTDPGDGPRRLTYEPPAGLDPGIASVVDQFEQQMASLSAFDGQAYELDIEATQEVLASTIEQSGVSIDVVGSSGTITGINSGRLDLPLAVSGSSEGQSEIEMTYEQDGTEHTQKVSTTTGVELAPRSK